VIPALMAASIFKWLIPSTPGSLFSLFFAVSCEGHGGRALLNFSPAPLSDTERGPQALVLSIRLSKLTRGSSTHPRERV
jgi:hypothetical protein